MTFAIADKRLFRLGLILCAVVIVADQISKAIMMSVLEQHPYGISVLPVFSLVTAWNKGVSFSQLRGLPPQLLSGFAILVSLGLIYWLSRVDKRLIAVAIVRVLPIAPYSIVSLAAGIAGIGRVAYFAGTALGMLPGIVLYALFADRARKVIAEAILGDQPLPLQGHKSAVVRPPEAPAPVGPLP